MVMTTQPATSIKRCATCNFWGGARSINSSKNLVTFDTATKGLCLAGTSKAEKSSNMNCDCSKYDKWSVLK